MSYGCDTCGMEIEPITCAKCSELLVVEIIDHEGEKVSVAKCPICQGMIKSPQCCGHDMIES